MLKVRFEIWWYSTRWELKQPQSVLPYGMWKRFEAGYLGAALTERHYSVLASGHFVLLSWQVRSVINSVILHVFASAQTNVVLWCRSIHVWEKKNKKYKLWFQTEKPTPSPITVVQSENHMKNWDLSEYVCVFWIEAVFSRSCLQQVRFTGSLRLSSRWCHHL